MTADRDAVAFVFDLHGGGSRAPHPQHWWTGDGEDRKPLVASPLQVRLYDSFCEWRESAIAANPATVVLGGDLTDGVNRNEGGRGVQMDLPSQIALAVDLLRPLITGRRVIWLRGSNYHESVDTDIMRSIAELSGADSDLCGGAGKLLRRGKIGLWVTHQLAGTLPNAWHRQASDATAGYALGRIDTLVRGIVAGHIHEHWELTTPMGVKVVVARPWVALTGGKPTAKKMLTYAACSEPGGLIARFNGDRIDFEDYAVPICQLTATEL
jgi:hypothetical protein